MSYLQLDAGLPNFTKIVVSLWFRVPQESLDAAAAQALPGDAERDINYYFPAFQNVIPLLTFGSLETALTNLGHGSGAYPVAPSFVGVDCSPGGMLNTLAVHLSMSNNSTFEGGPPQFIGSLQRPDAFYMSGYGVHPFLGTEVSQLEVTPDQWHHILISFDLTTPAVMNYSTAGTPGSIKPVTMPLGGPTFMWAFDDVDKTDLSLSPSCAQLHNILPPESTFVPPPTVPMKQITTNNLIGMAGGATAFTATWASVPVHAEGNPVALPTSTMFAETIHPVEMAELQIFLDVTLDTSDVDNRRAFISADGTPVSPLGPRMTDETGEPVLDEEGNPLFEPSAAETLLGKKPEILLHGSGNWIRGNNTGAADITGLDPDTGEPIADPADFIPTGQIVSYSPGPSLHGPQAPPEPAARRSRVAH